MNRDKYGSLWQTWFSHVALLCESKAACRVDARKHDGRSPLASYRRTSADVRNFCCNMFEHSTLCGPCHASFARLTKRSLLFETREIHMGFVEYEAALGRVFLRVLLLSNIIITPPTSLTYHLRCIILATGSFVQYFFYLWFYCSDIHTIHER
jgi:hypothetical protein